MVTTIKSITGYDDYLYHHMKESFKKAKKIDIIVSFLMESGVKLLEQDLIELKTKKYSDSNLNRELFEYYTAFGVVSIKRYFR